MKVYDIKNAGPRNRFMVRGATGAPLIVHNCTQSLARDIIGGHMLQIDKKYPVVGTVHDEIICVVPEAEAEAAGRFMLEVMRTPPAWARSTNDWSALPLDAEVGIGDNYLEAK